MSESRFRSHAYTLSKSGWIHNFLILDIQQYFQALTWQFGIALSHVSQIVWMFPRSDRPSTRQTPQLLCCYSKT